MRESLSTLRDGKFPFLAMVLVATSVLWLPAVVIAQEGEASSDSVPHFLEGLELENEWAEDQAIGDFGNKALACSGTNKYCHGLYEEMIYWVRYYRTGKIELFPFAAVRQAAAQVCPLYQGNKILIQADEPYADRLLNQMTVARVLGQRFRLDWATGTSGFCEVKFIIVPY